MSTQSAVSVKDPKILGILFVAIILTIVYMLIISSVSIKLSQDDQGRIDKLSPYKAFSTSNSYVLNKYNEVALQKFELNTTYESYVFCFEGQVNATNYVTGIIVNQDDEVLSKEIIMYNATTKYCAGIDKSLVQKTGFYGLKCLDCDSNDNVTLYKETLGTQVYQINDGSLFFDRTLAFSFNGYKNTGELLRIYNDAWILMMIGVLLSLGFIYSFKGFENLVDSDKP